MLKIIKNIASSNISIILPVLAITLTYSITTYAKKNSELPQCPKANVIQAAGVTDVKRFGDGWVMVSPAAKYGTTQDWYFAMDSLKGKDADEAKQNALQVLKHLKNYMWPMPAGKNWVCLYIGGAEDQQIIASTVPYDQLDEINF